MNSYLQGWLSLLEININIVNLNVTWSFVIALFQVFLFNWIVLIMLGHFWCCRSAEVPSVLNNCWTQAAHGVIQVQTDLMGTLVPMLAEMRIAWEYIALQLIGRALNMLRRREIIRPSVLFRPRISISRKCSLQRATFHFSFARLNNYWLVVINTDYLEGAFLPAFVAQFSQLKSFSVNSCFSIAQCLHF